MSLPGLSGAVPSLLFGLTQEQVNFYTARVCAGCH